nr:glycosyltransferase 87 family protein [Micromonospora sp. NBRC 107566]
MSIVVVLAAVTTAFALWRSARHGLFDLKVYYGAVNFWVHGGELYDYLKPFSTYGFTYPTFAALTMLPMVLVPWPVAAVFTVLFGIAAAALVLWWVVTPVARRVGWPPWFAYAISLALVIAYEPMRETINFGQVNMILLFLVAADLLRLVARRHPLAGVGIGLATAIKLTPGIFILYLLLTRRWRAALVASGTFAGASVLAGAVAPNASREFWTSALWDTDRVGRLDFVSNQSLQGVVARMNSLYPSRLLWLLLVVLALVVWAWRVWASRGDELFGLAVTGVVGALISPVTWIHHLVWLIPALVLLCDVGPYRRPRLFLAGALYLLLCSRLVWHWQTRDTATVVGFVFSNAYVWASVLLLLIVPLPKWRPGGSAEADRVADLEQGFRARLGS